MGIKALAHVTGGGFPDNLPRVLPAGLGIELDLSAIAPPPVFSWLAQAGGVAEAEMLRTFNCGIGMAVVVSPEAARSVSEALRAEGEAPMTIGRVIDAPEHRVRTRGALAL